MFRTIALLSLLSGAVARRKLREHDLHYGLDAFNANFNSRAPQLFGAADHFHRRLYEHESALPDDRLQTYLASMHPAHAVSADLTAALARSANLTVHTVVGGDLMFHGTREHADVLREQAEVRAVVPLLPELKVSPHLERLLPPATLDASLTVRLIPLERHEHVRRPAASIVDELVRALSAPCEARPVWARPPAVTCDATAVSARVTVRVEGERTLAVERLSRPEALAVANVAARLPEALWVEPHPEYRILNADGVAITQSGSPTLGDGSTPYGTTPIHAMGLHGEGEIIGVGDSGLDTGHCFFEDAAGGTAAGQTYGPTHRKVVAYRGFADNLAVGQQDHGTHVVGSILGESSVAGAQGATEQGSAYKAKVSFTDIGPGNSPGLAVPRDLVNNFFNVDYANGARIHSNSWGANINAYTIPTRDVDEFMHDFDDMVILFAAGNSGDQGPASIGAPATCKNCITVGASENNEPPNRYDGNMATFSSIGPATPTGTQGRYKPDVVAPGFAVQSANSNAPGNCPITPLAGTSMATPITAGDVALIRQYLREGYFPTGSKGGGPPILPSGALMKAMVIHSSTDIAGGTYRGQTIDQVPSHIQGFGRVQLNKVLFGPEGGGARRPSQRLFFSDNNQGPLANGAEHTYTIPIASGALTDPILGTEFKVTLVWTDPPAEPLDNNLLKNNLDLEVSVGGTLSRGNGPQPDTINTVEQVTLPSVPAGSTVEIKVKGTAVTIGTQRYALVVTGPTDAEPETPPERPGVPSPPGFGLRESSDSIAVGVTIPFLLIAIGSASCFMFKRRGGSSRGPGGGGSKAVLPPGWRQLSDPRSGAPYYMNEQTGATQWDPPPFVKAAAATPTPPPPTEGAPTVPAPWTSVVDPASGRTYYYNPNTGATQWTLPES